MPSKPPTGPAWLASLAPEQRDRVEPYTEAGPPAPMLAKLSQPGEIPPGWGFQRKWDGMRVLVRTGPHEARLWARSGRDVTASFPEIVERLAGAQREAIVDGEIVVLEEGTERFGRLQRRMNVDEPSPSLVARIPVQLAVFDVLQLDGFDVRRLPQRGRERLLKELAPGMEGVILARTVAHDQGAHQAQEAACRLGWEGLIAKDPTSGYRAGRQRAWRKLKCWQEETFTVVGYRDLEPGGGVGSLVLADQREGELSPVGSVGTGLTDDERARLHERLQPLVQGEAPLAVGEVRGEVHWVEPVLEVEVAYAERTGEGNLRHPRLRGLGSLRSRGTPA